MQRMFLRPRSLYNSVSTKGAKYPDTTTRFLYLSNTCGRSWYQRKILRLTRKYKLISKIFTRIPYIFNLKFVDIDNKFSNKTEFFYFYAVTSTFLFNTSQYVCQKKKKKKFTFTFTIFFINFVKERLKKRKRNKINNLQIDFLRRKRKKNRKHVYRDE